MPNESSPPLMLILAAFILIPGLFAFMYFATTEGAWSDFWSWALRKQRSGSRQLAIDSREIAEVIDWHDVRYESFNRSQSVDVPRPQQESAYQPRPVRPSVAPLYVPPVRPLLAAPRVADNGLLDVLLENVEKPVKVDESVIVVDVVNPPVYQFSIGAENGVQHLHKLDHFRFTRRTGGGKSVLLARVIPQLLSQGVEVWYINPKYMPVDEAGLDIQPIIDRCAKIAIGTDGRDAFKLLMDAKPLIQRRIKEAQETKRAQFSPVAIIVEELQTLMELWNDLDLNEIPGFKKAAKRGVSAINVILATGRQPKVFYGTTSQDAQVQNTGVNTGIGNNFGLSVMHPSLDRASLSNLAGGAELEFPTATSPYQWYVYEKNGLGRGSLVMVDVPMVENTWILDTLKNVPVVDRAVEQQKNSAANESKEPLRVLVDVAKQYFDDQQRPVDEPEDIPEERGAFDTILLVRAAGYLATNPNPSQRELAKHLFGKNGGRWNTRAGLIMGEVRRLERKVENGTADTA